MDLRKTLIIVSAALLVIMMVYLTFVKAKKPSAKNTVKPAATAAFAEAAAAEDEANPDCDEYNKAFVKTARTIKNSAIWENKGAPYVITGDITIAKGATFTLKPGVVIKLMGKDTDLIIKGKLVSKGTKDKPVIITSIKDDVGGDTNCDGGKSKPAAGDYGKVQVTGKATGTYEVRYAE